MIVKDYHRFFLDAKPELLFLDFEEVFLKEALFLLKSFFEGADFFFETSFLVFFLIEEASAVLEEVEIIVLISWEYYTFKVFCN